MPSADLVVLAILPTVIWVSLAYVAGSTSQAASRLRAAWHAKSKREVIEAWWVDYNTVRPHSSLRYLTPEEFAASAAARPASPPTPVVSIAPAWAGPDVQEPRSA